MNLDNFELKSVMFYIKNVANQYSLYTRTHSYIAAFDSKESVADLLSKLVHLEHDTLVDTLSNKYRVRQFESLEKMKVQMEMEEQLLQKAWARDTIRFYVEYPDLIRAYEDSSEKHSAVELESTHDLPIESKEEIIREENLIPPSTVTFQTINDDFEQLTLF